MMRSTTNIDIPVVNPNPAKTKLVTFLTDTYLILLQCFNMVTLAAGKIGGDLVAPIPHPWARYYGRVTVVEEGAVMPHSALHFIIGGLFAFAGLKSPGQPGFPYETHPRHVRFSVACLLIYGLGCVVELIVSAVGLPRTCLLAIIARLGKICFLCILVISLAYLVYV